MTLSLLDQALSRLPDVPGHVDVRGMLLSGKAEIRTAAEANPAQDGFVVLLAARCVRRGMLACRWRSADGVWGQVLNSHIFHPRRVRSGAGREFSKDSRPDPPQPA
jgi:hypothetical protein